MARKALVIGINEYDAMARLHSPGMDAEAIASRLRGHGDGSDETNFEVEEMIGTNNGRVTRTVLRAAIRKLFDDSKGLDVAFYFAGHGYITDAGSGYLVTADGEQDDMGIPMQEVIDTAAASPASSVLIMLDCCHSGAAGNPPMLHGGSPLAFLRDNMTIMAASLPMQPAVESVREGGLFTSALKDALDGTASDILGEITTASVYSVVERRFSLWDQRPVAKSYVTRRIILRKTKPRVSRQELRRIVPLFPTPDHKYLMDRDYDPERDVNEKAKTAEVPEKIEIGQLFKRYRDAGLLCASIPGEHFYYVAQRSHTVELTPFGKEYWRLVRQGRA